MVSCIASYFIISVIQLASVYCIQQIVMVNQKGELNLSENFSFSKRELDDAVVIVACKLHACMNLLVLYFAICSNCKRARS